MNIRDAILKAADHIQTHPKDYDFQSNHKPGCGTPGCMFGWVGHFLNVKSVPAAWNPDKIWMDDVCKVLGHPCLWIALSSLDSSHPDYMRAQLGDAAAAVNVLRAYADKYHPDIKADIDPAFAKFREQLLVPA
jgi:hypothetical protein